MLTGKQKSFLRAKGQRLKPVFQIGKTGLTAELLNSVLDNLLKNELLKVSILDTCPLSKEELINAFQDAGIELAGSIGKTLLLYKENPRLEQKITLPR